MAMRQLEIAWGVPFFPITYFEKETDVWNN